MGKKKYSKFQTIYINNLLNIMSSSHRQKNSEKKIKKGGNMKNKQSRVASPLGLKIVVLQSIKHQDYKGDKDKSENLS